MIKKNEQKVEFFSGYIDLAKEFIKSSMEKHFTVLSATYFIELIINDDSSHIEQPKKRFAEREFTPKEFLILSADWVEKTRNSANQEIDSYVAKHYGGTFQS